MPAPKKGKTAEPARKSTRVRGGKSNKDVESVAIPSELPEYKVNATPVQNKTFLKRFVGSNQNFFHTHVTIENIKKRAVINNIEKFRLITRQTRFDRRVTAIEWHPTHPSLLSIASKGGDVLVWDIKSEMPEKPQISGCGPGGSVQAVKFDPLNTENLYLVSLTGVFSKVNYVTQQGQVLDRTNDFDRWFTTCDVSLSQNIAVGGDTHGSLTMASLNGQLTTQIKVHKNRKKVTHVEFSKREPWLFCTASNDKTVKLWDMRMLSSMSEQATPLECIMYNSIINTAHFSRKDGCRLLTSDQADSIYVYRAPLFTLERTIKHPHRQFQYVTPIRADWHPLEDLIVIGRFPDKKAGIPNDVMRTMDFFDADSGEMVYQLRQADGIRSINRFNSTGEILGSSTSSYILLWGDLEGIPWSMKEFPCVGS